MSNSVTYVIYGCPIPNPRSNDPEERRELLEDLKDRCNSNLEPFLKQVYDQHEDVQFFGKVIATAQNGPAPLHAPNEDERAEVWSKWDEILSEQEQAHIGRPALWVIPTLD
jgi:hypothetical protein